MDPEPVLLIKVWIPVSKRVCGERGEEQLAGDEVKGDDLGSYMLCGK